MVIIVLVFICPFSSQYRDRPRFMFLDTAVGSNMQVKETGLHPPDSRQVEETLVVFSLP